MRDIRLIPWRQLGYRSESHVFNGEPDQPHGRHFVSSTDDDDAAALRAGRVTITEEATNDAAH